MTQINAENVYFTKSLQFHLTGWLIYFLNVPCTWCEIWSGLGRSGTRTLLGLAVLQVCKLINIAPTFSNLVSNTSKCSVRAASCEIPLKPTPIGYDQCKLCHLSVLISLTQIKSCFTPVLFVAAFVLTLGEKAFYVRIVGALGIKKCWWIAPPGRGQRTWIWDA